MRPASASSGDEGNGNGIDSVPFPGLRFRVGQKLCLLATSSIAPPVPFTSTESKAITWTREKLANLDMEDAAKAYQHARTANGIEPFGKYADDAPGITDSASSASTDQTSCSSASSCSATQDKPPRVDLHIDQTSSAMKVIDQVSVAYREYPIALVEDLHRRRKVYVRIQEIFPSSDNTAVLKCRLAANQSTESVGQSLVLKFQRDYQERDQERRAYQTLTAEQGDLVPYFYGEFVYEECTCLAIEYIPGPILLKCPDVLQNADTVTAFLRKFEHRWLSLLYHNLSHGDLSLHNVIMVNNSTPILVDFNNAWRIEMADPDFHSFYAQLYRSTLAVKAGEERRNWPYSRLIRATGVPYLLHCSAQRAHASAARARASAALARASVASTA